MRDQNKNPKKKAPNAGESVEGQLSKNQDHFNANASVKGQFFAEIHPVGENTYLIITAEKIPGKPITGRKLWFRPGALRDGRTLKEYACKATLERIYLLFGCRIGYRGLSV